MHSIGMYDRPGALDLTGFRGSGADFLEQYKKYIEDGETIIASPHKVYGPETNDLVLQLRKRDIGTVILAGMSANLCTESHLRELLEQGFEVVVVKDATAAASGGGRERLRSGAGELPLSGEHGLDHRRGRGANRAGERRRGVNHPRRCRKHHDNEEGPPRTVPPRVEFHLEDDPMFSLNSISSLAGLTALFPRRPSWFSGVAQTAGSATNPLVTYGTETIEGVDVFYREAGRPGAPQMVLLHGFPTSSHMFRNVIPVLAVGFPRDSPGLPGLRTELDAQRGRFRIQLREPRGHCGRAASERRGLPIATRST